MWHPLETSDWFSGDLCDTCCFSDSFAAAILHHHRRNIPSLLVLQPPRSCIPFSYCLTACHQLGWFLFRRAEIISVLSPTANSSLRQLGQTQPLPWRHAGPPAHVRGNPLVSRWDFSLDLSTLDAATGTVRRSPPSPFSSSFSRQSVSISSLQQLSNARANLLLFSSDFLRQSESSSLFQQLLNARANLLLFSSNFLTPERIFFPSPAISYARANLLLYSSDFLRQSDSSSLQFSHFRNFFCLHCSWWSGWCRHPTPPLLLRYNLLIVLGFFFRMPFFLVSMATISSRCHLKDFLSDIFSPSSFPAGTQAVVTFPSGRNHHSWTEGMSRGCDHNFGFGNLLGVLLSLQNDSSSSQTNILQSSRCISFWVDVSMIQGCRSYPCCWLVLPFPLLPAGTAYTHVFRSSNFSVLSFSILYTSIRSLSALDHLVFFTLYVQP